mgnify:FL=1
MQYFAKLNQNKSTEVILFIHVVDCDQDLTSMINAFIALSRDWFDSEIIDMQRLNSH